jgi:excisionase family DNA binding protein
METLPTTVLIPPEKRSVMNRDEAADYLRVSVRLLTNLVAARKIRGVRIGRRVVFRRADLDHYVDVQAALAT